MSEKSVTLKHVVRREGKQEVYFYDGYAVAENGLLTLPADRPEWIKKAWLSGYNLNPADDTRLNDWAAVENLVANQSTKSTGDSVEDTNAGRQPKATDRVRSSEQADSGSVSESGSRSDSSRSVNDGKAKTSLAKAPVKLEADTAK